jgi:hypothetical protein
MPIGDTATMPSRSDRGLTPQADENTALVDHREALRAAEST